jgi:hypothetical protein
MAIIGAHMLLYSAEPEALRAVLRDVFGFRSVNAGGGWLIFALPPAELGVHPTDDSMPGEGVHHEVSLMCDDIHRTVTDLRARGIQIQREPVDHGYGISVMMTLPGGVQVQLYEPRHPLAIANTGSL